MFARMAALGFHIPVSPSFAFDSAHSTNSTTAPDPPYVDSRPPEVVNKSYEFDVNAGLIAPGPRRSVRPVRHRPVHLASAVLRAPMTHAQRQSGAPRLLQPQGRRRMRLAPGLGKLGSSWRYDVFPVDLSRWDPHTGGAKFDVSRRKTPDVPRHPGVPDPRPIAARAGSLSRLSTQKGLDELVQVHGSGGLDQHDVVRSQCVRQP